MVNSREDVCTYCDCLVHPGDGRIEKRNDVWTVIHIDCLKERNKEIKKKVTSKVLSNVRNTEEDVCIYCDCIVPPNKGYLEVQYGRTVAIHDDCLLERNAERKRKA